MISRELAGRLSDRLTWKPANGDLFFIPRPEISDSVFLVSDMVVELIVRDGQRRFHFNGTVEWALDSVEVGEVVWLPREDQLRDLIGDRFVSLDRTGDGYLVTLSGPPRAFHTPAQPSAADAYAIALLHLLDQDPSAVPDRSTER
ncbi:pilus assembly protein CpaE [Microlunatus parietis]|uniref:Pilus assembly protein CpaE n=1 Tax=Microlunatus parietis TaxID=682979 RepID=A0A7Y9IDJ3_9ACTN|nr:pilus assembly protein CpaE [Microlunatus parietis]NYE74770.1 hypothetical protein [Microlunatus parietis]